MGDPRLLAVSIGVDSFPREDAGGEPDLGGWADLPYAPERVDAFAKTLAALGYQCATPGPLAARDLGRTVHDLIGQAGPDDAVVVHVLSHGDLGRTGSLYVVGADGEVDPGTEVDGWLKQVEDLPGRPVALFLLDLCHAGAAARLGWQLRTANGPGRAWVIAATEPDQQAFNGRFTRALTSVVAAIADPDRNRLGIDPSVRHVPLPTVAREIRRTLSRLVAADAALPQQVVGTLVDVTADLPDLPFFPNHRHRAGTDAAPRADLNPGLTPFLDDAEGSGGQLGRIELPTALDPGLDPAHYAERAAGHAPIVARAGLGCFSGREHELQTLSTWIDGHDPVGTRVVTGSPGVGKSALLGILVCAAHPDLREKTRPIWTAVDIRPYRNADFAAVHARQRGRAEITESLGRQLFPAESDVDWTVERLAAALAARPAQPVLVIDALDEAVDARRVLEDLLLPLSRARRADGRPAARLLIGARPWAEFDPLLRQVEAAGGLIDLDRVPRQTLQEDLEKYVAKLLRADPRYRPVRMAGARSTFAQALAEKLAEPAADAGDVRWGEFLVAGLYTYHVLTTEELLREPLKAADLGLGAPTTLPEILELDLAARPESGTLRAVLAALAHARGEGMPARLAAQISGWLPRGSAKTGTVDEAADALAATRFYLRSSADTDGTTLYRLFHQGLADHLRATPSDVDPFAGSISGLLVFSALVGPTQGQRAWDLAEPYLLRHALAHAADANLVGSLLGDAEFLVHADPALVLAAIEAAAEVPPAAEVYRALDEVPATATGRRAALTLAAARAGEADLAWALANPPGQAAAEWVPVWAAGRRERRDIDVAARAPGERPVAVVAAGTDVRVWDLSAGHPAGPGLRAPQPVSAVATAQVGDRWYAAAGGRDGGVRAWDAATGEVVLEKPAAHGKIVRAVRVIALGTVPVAVSAADDRLVRVWDLRTGSEVGAPRSGYMSGQLVSLDTATYGPTQLVLAGSTGGRLFGWDLADTATPAAEPVLRLTGHNRAVLSVACVDLPTGRVAVTAGAEGMIFWDLPDLRLARRLGTYLTKDAAADAVAIGSVDGEPVALAAHVDQRLAIWSLVAPAERGVVTRLPARVEQLAVTVIDGVCTALVVCGGGRLFTVALPAGEPRPLGEQGVYRRVIGTGFTSSATAAGERWDAPPGQPPGPAEEVAPVTAIGRLHDPDLLLLGFGDGAVRVVDSDGRQVFDQALDGPIDGVFGSVVADRQLVEAVTEHVTVLWDLIGQTELVRTGEKLSDPFWRPVSPDAAIVHNGQLFLPVGESDGVLSLHRYADGTAFQTAAHDGEVRVAVRGKLDGQTVVISAGADGWVRFWDVDELRELSAIEVPGAVTAVVPLSDDRIAVHCGGEVLLYARGGSA
jgi:WD40 repeat protein